MMPTTTLIMKRMITTIIFSAQKTLNEDASMPSFPLPHNSVLLLIMMRDQLIEQTTTTMHPTIPIIHHRIHRLHRFESEGRRRRRGERNRMGPHASFGLPMVDISLLDFWMVEY
jgi:hypothetical protein